MSNAVISETCRADLIALTAALRRTVELRDDLSRLLDQQLLPLHGRVMAHLTELVSRESDPEQLAAHVEFLQTLAVETLPVAAPAPPSEVA